MTDSLAFGLRLRGLREGRRIPLEHVAQATKIHIGRLTALERGDLSHWPSGIFARGFVRAYAQAIGVPDSPLVKDFRRVFPEIDAASDDDAARRLRLTLVDESAWTRAAAWLGRRFGRDDDTIRLTHRRPISDDSTGLRIV